MHLELRSDFSGGYKSAAQNYRDRFLSPRKGERRPKLCLKAKKRGKKMQNYFEHFMLFRADDHQSYFKFCFVF